MRAKSTPTDPVTIVDTETERLLRDRLAELRPGEHVLGEEGGGSADDSAGRATWVVDPIDGTVNFVYGLPAYAVSVAVQVDGHSIAGAVANVVDGAVYSAARGHGAHVRRGSVTVPLRASVRSMTCQCRWWAPDSAMTRNFVNVRRRYSRYFCRRSATSDGSVRRRWTSAWSPRANSTRTTRTTSTHGTGRRAR